MCIANYIKLNVSLISIILIIFAFSGANLAYESLRNNVVTEEIIYTEAPIEELEEIEINADDNIENELTQMLNLNDQIWQIEIPSIGLNAPIAQGTSQEVMSEFVGHFETTSFWKGNIGLAAHNRRIPNKLF